MSKNKFTDGFFRFPIFRSKIEKYLDDGAGTEFLADIKKGFARLPVSELDYLSWWSGSVEASDELAPVTIVYSPAYGHFICTWPMTEFEEKMNSYVEKLPDYLPSSNFNKRPEGPESKSTDITIE